VKLDYLEIEDADVRRLDEIITLHNGQSLAAEKTHWLRRRNRFWMTVFVVLLLLLAAVVLYQS
jgi:hypothetical protein